MLTDGVGKRSQYILHLIQQPGILQPGAWIRHWETDHCARPHPAMLKEGGQRASFSFSIRANKRNVEWLLKQSLNAFKLIQHRFNFVSTCFNMVEEARGGGGYKRFQHRCSTKSNGYWSKCWCVETVCPPRQSTLFNIVQHRSTLFNKIERILKQMLMCWNRLPTPAVNIVQHCSIKSNGYWSKCWCVETVCRQSTLFNIVQHRSTSFNIVQHRTTLLNKIERMLKQMLMCWNRLPAVNIVQHCSTSFNIVQHRTTLLNKIERMLNQMLMMCGNRLPTPAVNIVQHHSTKSNRCWSKCWSRLPGPLLFVLLEG